MTTTSITTTHQEEAMAVQVQTPELHADEYLDATSWHVDEERQLHVRGAAGKHVAVYAVNAWACARQLAPAQGRLDPDGRA